MKTRQQILDENPISRVLRDYGFELSGAKQVMLKCCFHEDGNASLSVNQDTGVFHCHACKAGGSVIDFVARREGLSIPEAMKRLANEPDPVSAPKQATVKPKGDIAATYSYRDEMGQELYQVVRMNPKDFRQRHQENGEWVWNMQGVRKVLYNLPTILKANSAFVWICEGEKDADNLKKCGYVGTTNVGGAGKWLDGYTDCLAGKEIILCGDNDDAGRAHMIKVLAALSTVAKTVRKIDVPAPSKDVSDYIATFNGDMDAAARALYELTESAVVLTGGVAVPVQTMAELEREYQIHIKDCEHNTLNLGAWLPSLGREVRGLVPGELVTLLADTGVGKTACLQNIAICAAPIQTILFELELPGTLTFERFVSASVGTPSATVYNDYKHNEGRGIDWRTNGKLNHIVVCSKSRVTPMDIEKIIIQTELKTGNRPKLVLVDYVGLVQGVGKSRYERVSSVAEEMKVVAKSTKTIIVIASQVARNNDENPEVCLHDGKDSGSIENSSGLVIGLWRDPKDATLLNAKILKNTKGTAGKIIQCNFHGATMQITERAKYMDPLDIPRNRD